MATDKKTNQPERLLAIGDIHGCREQLAALLAAVVPTLRDQVVFLGDYLDRGPDSEGVINDLIDFSQAFPSSIFLRGNHEEMFLNYLDGEDPMMFMLNGGAKTVHSYKHAGQWPPPQAHRDFIDSLQDCHETASFIFVHAGLRPGISLSGQDKKDFLWIRQEFINSDYDWGKTVVYGHTPVTEPFMSKTRLGIDTGCVYGRQLTCCDVLTRQFWQA